jgi:hypothetical protein
MLCYGLMLCYARRALGRAMPKGVRERMTRRRSTADMRGDAAQMMERVRLQYDAEGNRHVVASPESPRYQPPTASLAQVREDATLQELLSGSAEGGFDPRML